MKWPNELQAIFERTDFFFRVVAHYNFHETLRCDKNPCQNYMREKLLNSKEKKI